MSQKVKVKIRPGGTLDFPAMCVHCARPAGGHMPLKTRRGRLTRLIDVPLCDQCAAQLERKSGEEERLGRLGQFMAVLAALLVFVLGFLLLPDGLLLLLQLLIALVLAAVIGLAVHAFFRWRSLAAARPEKLEILASARMTEFSWRATTFYFDNDDFARRFSSMNEDRLMKAADNGKSESKEQLPAAS